MIIAENRDKVIDSIKLNIKNNELNKKVEVDDPNLTDEDLDNLVKNFYKMRKRKISFFLKSRTAYRFLDTFSAKLNNTIEIEGLENLKDIDGPAIITSNHFNPMDSMVIRKLIKEKYKKNLYIVSTADNLALPGFTGYLINHLNIIPLRKSPNYMNKVFRPNLEKVLNKKNFVLIYPEEEMWFNYRKPRPCKRGTYKFASELNIPVISCFVEMRDLEESNTDEYNKLSFVVHILKPIIPDKNKSSKENSIEMAEIDYKQKIEAYEIAYKKKLNYKFSYNDIAGLKKKKD